MYPCYYLQDKKDKKRDKKREKKKSRQTSKDSVRKKTSTADGGETGRAYLEASLLSFFQVVDPVDNGGYLEPPVFWEVQRNTIYTHILTYILMYVYTNHSHTDSFYKST